MEVTHCGLHGFGEAIGIDTDQLRMYWKLNFAGEHVQQAAYHLVVSTNRDFKVQQDVLFDSGRQAGSEQRNVICKPEGGFQSTTMYYWRVQVWDQDNNTTVSSTNEFYTSYPRSSRLLPPYSMNQTYVS